MLNQPGALMSPLRRRLMNGASLPPVVPTAPVIRAGIAPAPWTYPVTPDVDVAWYRAANFDNAVAGNLSQPGLTPTRSAIAHACGFMPNTTGSTTAPSYLPYQTGPDGVTLDAQICTFDAAEILYCHRSTTEGPLPAGTYTLAFDYVREGASDQDFQAGLATGLVNLTATVAWQSAALEFTYSGAGDIVIRSATGVSANVRIARRRLHPGTAASLPAWADTHFVGGRKVVAANNALTVNNDGVVLADGERGLMVYDKNYKTGGTTHTSILAVAFFDATGFDATQNNVVLATDEDAGLGTVAESIQLFLQNTTGFEGQITFEPFTESIRGFASVDCRDQGVIAVGIWLRNGIKTAFIDCIPARTTEEAFTSIKTAIFRQGANNGDTKPEKTAYNLPGTFVRTLIHAMPPSATLETASVLIQAAKQKVMEEIGDPSVGFPVHVLNIGDSNDQDSADGWTNIARRRNYLGGGRKALPWSILAVGGAGVTAGATTFYEQLDTGLDATDTNPDCGGWRMIDAAKAAAQPIIVSLRGGTNDRERMSSDYVDLFDEYAALYDDILARWEGVILHISSPLAIINDSGWPNFNTNRLLFAALQQAYAAANPRVFFCDVTNDPYLGSTAEANSGVSIYFEPLGVHLITAGDARMAEIQRPVLAAAYDYAVHWRKPLPALPQIGHILHYGQSPSTGAIPIGDDLTDPVSTGTYADALQFVGGAHMMVKGTPNYTSLVPLQEERYSINTGLPSSQTYSETYRTGWARMFWRLLERKGYRRADVDFTPLLSVVGVTGQSLLPGGGKDGLSRDLTTGKPYKGLLDNVTGGLACATALGKTYEVLEITYDQGAEDNFQSISGATHKAALKQLAIDLNADIKGITGQSRNVILRVIPDNSKGYRGRAGDSQIARAQIEAAQESDLIQLGPSQWAFITGVHYEPFQSYWVGANLAYYFVRDQLESNPVVPLLPTKVERVGNSYRATYAVDPGDILYTSTVFPPYQPDFGVDTWSSDGLTERSVSPDPVLVGNICIDWTATTGATGDVYQFGNPNQGGNIFAGSQSQPQLVDPVFGHKILKPLLFTHMTADNVASLPYLAPTGGIGNQTPLAPGGSASMAEDAVLSGTVPGSDPDGDTLTFSVVTPPASGVLVLNADGTYTYTPAANFNGVRSFVYQVADGNGGTATGTFTITITPVNDAPNAPDSTGTVANNATLSGTVVATDVDGDSLTYSVTVAPGSGSVSMNSAGAYTYTPAGGYTGSVSFTWQATDGTLSDTGTVTITVTAPTPTLPSSLDGRIAAWWSADHDVNITRDGSGFVSSWAPTVEGVTLLQATAGIQPVYDPTGWNGTSPAIVFDTDDYLRALSVPANAPTGAAPGEILIIVDQQGSDTTGTRQAYARGGTANGTFRGIRRAYVSSVHRARAGDGTNHVTEAAVTFTGRKYILLRYDGSAWKISVNGGSETSLTATTNTGTSRTVIGNTTSGVTNSWIGAIRDVIETKDALTSGERADLLTWAAGRV